MGAILSQSAFIGNPRYTADNLPNQHGKTAIITGGYSGIGYELARILYSRHCTVFIAGRDARKARDTIHTIRKSYPGSNGGLEFLWLDLSDLSCIRRSVEDFLTRSDRLDVLVNNAGIMLPPLGSKTVQGYELQLGTNCLGPHLLTELLGPLLKQTARTAEVGSVRILWASSVATELAPADGMPWEDSGGPVTLQNQPMNYAISKVGNIFLSTETARRYRPDKVFSIALNPGNLQTNLQRNMPWWQYAVARLTLYQPFFGACTMLYAGWSQEVDLSEDELYILPWGRQGHPRKDISRASAPIASGGLGYAEKFWLWCRSVTSEY